MKTHTHCEQCGNALPPVPHSGASGYATHRDDSGNSTLRNQLCSPRKARAGNDESCANCGYPFDCGDACYIDAEHETYCSKGCHDTGVMRAARIAREWADSIAATKAGAS